MNFIPEGVFNYFGSFFPTTVINSPTQETSLGKNTTKTFKFNSLAKSQDKGSFFFEYNSKKMKDLIGFNYFYNLNSLSYQFNRFEIPSETEELFKYAENVIEEYGEVSNIKNRVEMKSTESLCDKIYNTQMAFLSKSQNPETQNIKNFLEKIFESTKNAEIKYMRTESENEFNKMGFPFSRIATELLATFAFLSKNDNSESNTELTKNLVILISHLEDFASNHVKSSESSGESDDEYLNFDETNTLLDEFKQKALELNELFILYKEKVFKNSQKLPIFNSYSDIYITNRFLLFKSMLETLGSFYFSENTEIMAPTYFFGNLKEFYLHYILSITELSLNIKDTIFKIKDDSKTWKKTFNNIPIVNPYSGMQLKEIENKIGFSNEDKDFKNAGLETFNFFIKFLKKGKNSPSSTDIAAEGAFKYWDPKVENQKFTQTNDGKSNSNQQTQNKISNSENSITDESTIRDGFFPRLWKKILSFFKNIWSFKK